MHSINDDDYDDGSEESGKSRDWDSEPSDKGWAGTEDYGYGDDK